MSRFVVISGCSGGGKSTLLAELARRGHAVVEEPGRRIVHQEAQQGGRALPWIDMAAFLNRAIAMSLADLLAADAHEGWVFFDRGLIDAASALQHLTGEPILERLHKSRLYQPRVFLAPPWPEIYQTDEEHRHGWEAAVAEYWRLHQVYPALGYEVVLIPKATVDQRADFVLSQLTT